MKAAIQVDVGKYEIRDVPVPEIKETQCLLRVRACTICATDAKYFKGLQRRAWPSPMGHEVTGTIEKVGSAVEGFKEGDRVLSRIVWGGFAECVAADGDMLVHLPENVGFEEGAIGQLLPIAVRGAELSMAPGKTVFVSGLGGAGLLCVQVAKAYGASKVIAGDFFEMKRNVALEVGADVVVDPNAEDVVKRVRAETNGGADVAMEAVGLEPSFRACEAAVRNGGIISIFGTHLTPIELNLTQWEARSLQLHMMREQRHEMPAMLRKAAELLASGKVRLKPLLSRVMKLDDIMEAFDLYIHQNDKHIKIAIVP
ncbi:MAG: zinc-dependent alcohol dehydrogenase [Alphaproteobacteria bacterium]